MPRRVAVAFRPNLVHDHHHVMFARVRARRLCFWPVDGPRGSRVGGEDRGESPALVMRSVGGVCWRWEVMPVNWPCWGGGRGGGEVSNREREGNGEREGRSERRGGAMVHAACELPRSPPGLGIDDASIRFRLDLIHPRHTLVTLSSRLYWLPG